jgi:hypothetical protein
MAMGDGCDCGCDREPEYYWHDGLWTGGTYCEEYVRRKLYSLSDLPSYGTSAGAVPMDESLVIKTIEGLERWKPANE